MSRDVFAFSRVSPVIIRSILIMSAVFATPSNISFAQSCEDIYVPIDCKAKKGCDYDAFIDACITSKQVCSVGYEEGDKSCKRKSCGTHDGQERFYMDRWKEIRSYPGTCTSGLFAELSCDDDGLVRKISDGTLRPLGRDCVRVTNPR